MNEKNLTFCKIKKMDDIIVSEASVSAFLREWGAKRVLYQRFLDQINNGLTWQERLGKEIQNIIVNPVMFEEFRKLPEDLFFRMTDYDLLKKGYMGIYCSVRVWVSSKVQEDDVVFFDLNDTELAIRFPMITEFCISYL
jgi:hypothetical protein